ncbi:nucleotidyltransferase family protein [Thauera sp. 63]|jgi:predicted nucleotidyltransferase|uniref:nucleotidyltransferase family protein n=1 Tax=Thauera sp. 63 TaxID=497321 RepID=UPI0002CFDB50|nr:hypothetical protein [Thauera sp. 63]ENO78168.1 DNA polymerase, beta-like region [Thauera sp. 63]
MKPSEALRLYREQVRRIVAAHHARNACVFGSVLSCDEEEGRDPDLLIGPTPEATMMGIGAIRYALRKLLNLDVDVQTPRALPARLRVQVPSEAMPL